MTSTARDRAGTSRGLELLRRAWELPLAAHVALLALLVVGTGVLVGTSSSFSADEGAALLQVQALEGGSWLVDHPLPSLDPTGDWFVLGSSDGGPERFAPLAKHPAYPLLLGPPFALGGAWGAVAVSWAGAVAAALAAALLARRLRPGLERAALWAAGVGSPLFFDAQLVQAHTIGAACCGFAAVVALARDRGVAVRGVGAGALMAAAVLLRTEAVLFGVALGVALLLGGWVARRRIDPVGLVVAAVAVAVHLLERRWVAAIVDASPELVRAGLRDTSSLVETRARGLVWTFLATSGAEQGTTAALALGLLLAVAVAALAVRARPPLEPVARVASVAVVLIGLALALVPDPDAISGLLAASPVVLAGVLLVRRRPLADAAALTAATAVLLFAGAVVATQYEVGGAAEWGGRFLAVALPVAVPVAILLLDDARGAVAPATARWGVAALVVASIGLAVLGARVLHTVHDRHAEIVEAVSAVTSAGSGSEPDDADQRRVVLTTWGLLGRLSWREGGVRGLLAGRAELAEAAAALRQRGGADGSEPLLVTTSPEADVAAVESSGYQVVGREPVGDTGVWLVELAG